MGVPTVEEVADFEGALNAFRRALEEEEEETSLAEDVGAGSAALLGVGIAPKADLVLGDSQNSLPEDWDVETGQEEWGDEDDAMELSGLDLDEEELGSLAPVADAKPSAAVLEAAAVHRTSGFEIATPGKSEEAVSIAASPCGDGESDSRYVGGEVKDHSVPPSADEVHLFDREEDRNKLNVPEISETQDMAGAEGCRAGPCSGAEGSDDLMEGIPDMPHSTNANGEEQNECTGVEREAEQELAPDDHLSTDRERLLQQDFGRLLGLDLEEEPGSFAPVADAKRSPAGCEAAAEDVIHRILGFEIASSVKSKEAVSIGAAPCGEGESDTTHISREVQDHIVPPSSDAVHICDREEDENEVNESEMLDTQNLDELEECLAGPHNGAEGGDDLMEATSGKPCRTNVNGKEENECTGVESDTEMDLEPDVHLLTDSEGLVQQHPARLLGLDLDGEEPGSLVPVANAKPSTPVLEAAVEDAIHRTSVCELAPVAGAKPSTAVLEEGVENAIHRASGFEIALPVKSEEAVSTGAGPCGDGEADTLYMGPEVKDQSVLPSSDAVHLCDREDDQNKVNESEMSETQNLDGVEKCLAGPHNGAEGSEHLMEATPVKPCSTNSNGEEHNECTGAESEAEMELELDVDLLTDSERILQPETAGLLGLDLDEEEPGTLVPVADVKPSTAVFEEAVEDAIHRTSGFEIALPLKSEEAVSIGAAPYGDGESVTLYVGPEMKDQSVLPNSGAVHLCDREEDQDKVNVSEMPETQDLAGLPECGAGSYSGTEGSDDLMEATPEKPHSTHANNEEQNECACVDSEAELEFVPDDHLLTDMERASQQDSAKLDELAKAAVLRTVFGDMDETTVSTDGDDGQSSSSSEDDTDSAVDHPEEEDCAMNVLGTHVLGTSPEPLENLSVFLNGGDMEAAPTAYTEIFSVGSLSGGARDAPNLVPFNLSGGGSFLEQSDMVQRSTSDVEERPSDCIMETVEASSPRQNDLQVCRDSSQPVLGGASDAANTANFNLSGGSSFLDQSDDMVLRGSPDGGGRPSGCLMETVETVQASSFRQDYFQICRDASQPVLGGARDAPNYAISNLPGGVSFLDPSDDMVLRGNPDGGGKSSDCILKSVETTPEPSSPCQDDYQVCRDASQPVPGENNIVDGLSAEEGQGGAAVQMTWKEGDAADTSAVCESQRIHQEVRDGNKLFAAGWEIHDASPRHISLKNVEGSSAANRSVSTCLAYYGQQPGDSSCEMDLSLTVGLQDTRTNTKPSIFCQDAQGTPGLHRVNSRSMMDEQLPGKGDFDTHLSLHVGLAEESFRRPSLNSPPSFPTAATNGMLVQIESSTLHMQPGASAECHGGSDTVNWEVTTMSLSSSQPFSQEEDIEVDFEGENADGIGLTEVPAIGGTAGGEIPSTVRSALGENLGSNSNVLPLSDISQVYYGAEGEMIGNTESRVASSQERTDDIDLPADGKVDIGSDGLSSEPSCSSYISSVMGNALIVPEAECERTVDLDLTNGTTNDGDAYGDLPTYSEPQNFCPALGFHNNESVSKPFIFHQHVESVPVLDKVTGVSANFDEHLPEEDKPDMDFSRHVGPLESYSGALSMGASAGTFGAISSSKSELVGDGVADRIYIEENLVSSSAPQGPLANIPKSVLHVQAVCSTESPGISETINCKNMTMSLGNSSSLAMVENVQVDAEDNIDLAIDHVTEGAAGKGMVNTSRVLAGEKIEKGEIACESNHPVVSIAQDPQVAPGAEEVDRGCEGLILERKVPLTDSLSVAEGLQKEECSRSDGTDFTEDIAGDGAAGRDMSSDGEPTLGNTRVYSELRALMDLVKAQTSPHEKIKSGSENDRSARLLDSVPLEATPSDPVDSAGNKGEQEALNGVEKCVDPLHYSSAELGSRASEETSFGSFHSDSLIVDLGLPVADGQGLGAMLQYVHEGAVSSVIEEETMSSALPGQQKDTAQIVLHEDGQIAQGLGSSSAVPVLNVTGSSEAAAISQGTVAQAVGQTAEHPIIDLNASDASPGSKTRGRKRGAVVQTYKPRKRAAKEPVPAVNGTEGPQPTRTTRRRPAKDAQVTGLANSGTGSAEHQLPFGTWALPMNSNRNPVEIANVQEKPKVRLKVLARKGAQGVQSQHSGPVLTPVSHLPALAQAMALPVGTQPYHFPFYPHPASVWPMRLMDPGIVASGPTPTPYAETQGPAFLTQSGPPTADRQGFPVLESAPVPSASQSNHSLTPAGYSLPPPSLGWPFAPRLEPVHPSGVNQWVLPPGPNHTPPQEVEKPTKRKPRRKAQASVPSRDVEPPVADGNEAAGADGRRKRQRRATGELNFSQLQQDIHRVRSIISRRLEAWGSHCNLLQVPGGEKGAGDLHLIFDEEQREEFVQQMVTSCQANPRMRALFLGAVRRIADYSVIKTAASQSRCEAADEVVTAWEQMKLHPSASPDPFYKLCKAVDTLHKESNASLDEVLALQDPEFALLNRTADGKWDVRIPPPVGKAPVVKATRKGVAENGDTPAAASHVPASS